MKIKKGFTLIEIMIALLISAIFIAAATPLITRKHLTPPDKVPHGQYICYSDTNGVLKESFFTNKIKIYDGVAKGSGGKCEFVPPKGAKYFLVQAVGGGGGGGVAGDALLTSRTSSNTSGSIPFPFATASLPSWLTPAQFVSYGGTIKATACGGDGGKGGDFFYIKTTSCGLPTCPGTTMTKYGQQGGYGYSCSVSKPAALNMVLTLNNGAKGTDGTWGGESEAGYSPYSTTEGQKGTAGTSGSLTFQGTSCSAASGGTGGNGGTKYTSYTTTSRASGGSVACVSGPSPAALNYTDVVQTKFLTYGAGGSAGKFSTIFIPSLKSGIPITLGLGGQSGLQTADGKGGIGGNTAFGALLTAEGGAGGGAKFKSSPYTLTGQALVKVDDLIPAGSRAGQASTFSAFQQIIGMGSYTGSNTGSTNYGGGGTGGGSYSQCNSGSVNRTFNGNQISSGSAACTDSTANNFYDVNTGVGTFAPSIGQTGAIIIVW